MKHETEVTLKDTLYSDVTVPEAIAISASVIASFVPVVGGGISSMMGAIEIKKHTLRVEQALEQINKEICALQRYDSEQVTAPQLQLVNGVFLTLFETFDDKKLPFLRKAILNGLGAWELRHAEAMQISRVIRDITAEELVFMVENIESDGISYEENEVNEQHLRIVPGLISLGALAINMGRSGVSSTVYRFTPLATKLVRLVS